MTTEHSATVVDFHWRPGRPHWTALLGPRRSGLPVREINIWEDRRAAARARSVADGHETVPTVFVPDIRQPSPRVLTWVIKRNPGRHFPDLPRSLRCSHSEHGISRFPGRDCFAAYDGAAPDEVSSGGRVSCRLSLRGNRRLNHAIHMAAVTQIRHRHTTGRAYYDKKLAEGKTPKEALRALKRQVSDAIYQHLKADARRAAAAAAITGPGGHPGNDTVASAAGLHPADRLFGPATPGPAPTLRSRPAPAKATPRPGKPRRTRQSVHVRIR